MKIRTILDEIISERVFSYKKEKENTSSNIYESYFTFKTAENKYGVSFTGEIDKFLSVEFFLDLGGDYSYEDTDENIVFSVLQTVAEIAKSVWEDQGENFQGFKFSGISSFDSSGKPHLSKRNRVFISYLKRQFPNIETHTEGSTVYIKIVGEN